MHPVEQYLSDMGAIRATQAGTGETSYYTALSTLLNEIGSTLNPKVRCVIQLQNKGAGMPDGGMFTADQFKTKAAKQNAGANPLAVLPPSRGVIEVKSPAEDMPGIIASEQIARYWEHYGLVLVTNYRAFTLIGRTPSGGAVELESFTLAGTEAEFWKLAAHPRTCPDPVRERFAEYLHRVMIHNAPLASPQDVAAILASYARDAKARIGHADLPALAGLREALENALGLKFEGEKGEHFFRSTLIQTLFYGIFSAWVLWARKRKPASAAKEKTLKYALKESAATYHAGSKHFDWHTAVWHLRVPMIRALFEQVATPARLGPLGLEEVLDWAAGALNRVDGDAFFTAFDEGHAVQYFYEPFLQAFDPELRKDLGVWYTPTEIVDYQVERVDTVLRDELHIADGLADPRVIVLDPCCGTGAYVRSVLHRIAKTLDAKGGDGLTAQDLKTAALERVLGFEILPAPFVIAHLQIGLMLDTLGAPLNDAKDERVGVYLTNALTGWEPPKEPKTLLLFPEMAEERDAADRIKRRDSILVILGNPPYNGFAGVALAEERDLSNAYRTTQHAPPPQGQGLNDLYIRFFRMAERRIVEMNRPGQGIISFISNYSWLDGLSFTGMRERYLEVFERIWIDNLHGDRIISEYAPDGQTSETVFSVAGNSTGIKVGTAISLLVKKSDDCPHQLNYRDMDQARASDRRAALLSGHAEYTAVTPCLEIGLPFKPRAISADYLTWPRLTALFPTSFPGVKTSRDDFLIDTDRDRLLARLQAYFDPAVSHTEMLQLNTGVMEDTARFKGEAVRDTLRKRGFLPDNIVRYCYRPFDTRWLYWEPETKLLDEKRSEYFPHVFPGNVWIEARQHQPQEKFDRGYFLKSLADNFGNGLSNFFPLYLHSDGSSLLEPAGKRSNLSDAAAAYLTGIAADPEDLFYHALAILHAQAYRTENAGALRQDWPRVPLPATKDALLASSALGRQVAALLDTETPVAGVTAGKISEDLKALAVFTRTDGQPVNPDAGDLELTAGWGHAGKGGVTMPGRGKIETSNAERPTPNAEGNFDVQSSTLNVQRSIDVFLNDKTCWRNVPAPVWEYTIGGYQVIKKWLSYREKPLLGRGLTVTEVRTVTETARRIAALIAMQPQLDGNYGQTTSDIYFLV
jgi:hypothetical protein